MLKRAIYQKQPLCVCCCSRKAWIRLGDVDLSSCVYSQKDWASKKEKNKDDINANFILHLGNDIGVQKRKKSLFEVSKYKWHFKYQNGIKINGMETSCLGTLSWFSFPTLIWNFSPISAWKSQLNPPAIQQITSKSICLWNTHHQTSHSSNMSNNK